MAKSSKSSDISEQLREQTSDNTSPPQTTPVEIPHSLSLRQLAELLEASPVDIIKQLMRNGIMANINRVIDYKAAAAVAAGLGYEAIPQSQLTRDVISGTKKQREFSDEELSVLQPRPPVVTVMGHVNHGKTRLLDAIRQTNVMANEAGSITQHIGAYQVEVNGQRITFLDTPGHEAFTAMRTRGAQVTDVTILVVAADDGVMPQTLEAIDHARAAGVPIVVAINKIDKPDANIDLVKQQLADADLVIEDWGGDTICIPISAREKIGISVLLENLLLLAEIAELKANLSQPAEGVVIEAEMDKTRGPLATVLVQNGTLKVGDTVAIGTTWGRIRAMFNDMGKQVRKAGASAPVVILGLNSVPQVGDTFSVAAGEHQARALIQKRQKEIEESSLAAKSVRLSNLFDQISAGQVKELNVILKTDVQGSIEPIRTSLERLGTEEVQVRIIHSGSSNITKSDVMLAIASKGLIIGFNISAEPGARRLAEIEGVDIRFYDVIYNLIDDVEKALKGMLAPTYVEVIDGRAEVRAVFSRGKHDKAAGAYITEGKVTRGVPVRVQRQKQVVIESTVSSLRRFKDDAKEVAIGYECGVGIADFKDFQVGDILEFFHKEKSN
ncbi:translation initiation factor IF-2 [Chloroflexota bacterium]